MKRLKKTLALALALILTLAMSTAVFADNESGGNETHSITITGAPSGHTYEAYQIFTGTVSGSEQEGYTLANVQWGSGVSGVNTDEGLKSTADLDAATEAGKLTNEAAVKAYSQKVVLAEATARSEVSVNGDSTVYTISGLAAGYYLIKDDEEATLGEGDAFTSYIVQVVGEDVFAQTKASSTTSEKKVMDVNDSNGEKGDWEDSADYDIGDDVPFKLTANITEKYGDYSTYYLAFEDTYEKGLTFNQDVKVYVQNGDTESDISEYFTVTDDPENRSFEVVCANTKNIKSITKDSKINVYYTATLNEDAELGATGNRNTLQVVYSNNPNGTGTGTTTPDTVVVFTYKVEINKVDGSNTKLPGADFVLYKKYKTLAANEVDYTDDDGNVYKIIPYEEDAADNPTTFTFKGIDDGDYILHEAVAPTGYNSISDIAFTVSAIHEEEAEDPQLTSLTVTGDADFDLLADNVGVSTDVTNYKGSTLPSTGGTGRVLLYVVGAILVAGVGVILVSKKRAQQ